MFGPLKKNMSTIKIGINGFGRIGRMVFRASLKRNDVQVVGINDLLDVEHLAYLLKYDSVHGTCSADIEVKNGDLIVDGNIIRITSVGRSRSTISPRTFPIVTLCGRCMN